MLVNAMVVIDHTGMEVLDVKVSVIQRENTVGRMSVILVNGNGELDKNTEIFDDTSVDYMLATAESLAKSFITSLWSDEKADAFVDRIQSSIQEAVMNK